MKVILKAVRDIFAGKCKNNNGILNDIFLSIIFTGSEYYIEITELTIPKLEMWCGHKREISVLYLQLWIKANYKV